MHVLLLGSGDGCFRSWVSVMDYFAHAAYG